MSFTCMIFLATLASGLPNLRYLRNNSKNLYCCDQITFYGTYLFRYQKGQFKNGTLIIVVLVLSMANKNVQCGGRWVLNRPYFSKNILRLIKIIVIGTAAPSGKNQICAIEIVQISITRCLNCSNLLITFNYWPKYPP